ncbi:hypothetical protein BU14_0450s0013 [Porphyra umbilicalis]|uniref:Sugar phosphate transporter domain-containing protein n=1 Tax=Porphyra umbilicalis TaxID=2786 RepID=A0A1X6NUL1_PORUM|nr:hypothetical protein BU14_0450s0013 [Porphyra umbilicalis]|eukprot:OSX72298.1 hypothetical protein BU14_0450s0013 [Porphyra umbilicalis]
MAPQPPLWRTILVLGLYYSLSASVILILKWALSGSGSFPFPLTILLVSNSITSVWAVVVTRLPRFRPAPLTAAQLKGYVVPIGLCTAMEIGFSNMALKILTVSFGTILKGASPVFVMLWGLAFGVEVFTCPLFVALLIISGGVGLAAFGEVDFVLSGFLLQLSATALGGFRLALTHVLLHGMGEEPMPPLTATLYTAPATALFVLPFAAGLEGRHVAAYVADTEVVQVLRIAGVLSVVATFVFLLLISEYSLVRDTSSLALSVAAVFKELLTIGGAVVFFHDHLSLLNSVGFLLCHVGIGYYVYLRSDRRAAGGGDRESLPTSIHPDDAADGMPLMDFDGADPDDAFTDAVSPALSAASSAATSPLPQRGRAFVSPPPFGVASRSAMAPPSSASLPRRS